MSANAKSIMDLIKAGEMNQELLSKTFAGASSGVVSIEDWGVCYSSATGQLSEYCTVVATNPSNPITGAGMLAYSADGSSLYCAQYTNNFTSTSLGTSVGTTLYNPQQGNTVQCIVYGWTEQSNFYFTQTLTIVPCQ